jgi:predicted alpha/beta-hydrolase family hydrolase
VSLLLVPGQKIDNKVWAEELAAGLGVRFAKECSVFSYPWWFDKSLAVDPHQIAKMLAEMAPSIIVAKSIGSLLTALSASQYSLAVKTVVLIGVPIGSIGVVEKSWLRNIAVPDRKTLVIQQSQDKAGSFKEVCNELASPFVDFVEVTGSDHSYSNVKELIDVIATWFNESGISNNSDYIK